MKWPGKSLIAVVILGAGGYGAGSVFWKTNTPIATADLKEFVPDERVAVKRGDIRRVVNSSGKVLPNQEIRLKCKASGQIIEMPFGVSDKVKKGDLLFRLDPADEERNTRRAKVALAVSQNRLEATRVQYDIAAQTLKTDQARVASEINSAKVKLDDLTTTLNRARQLFQKDLISREELEKTQVATTQGQLALDQSKLRLEEMKTAELALRLKKNDIEVAKAQVETDELKLQDAQQRLNDTKVFAPVDGVISTVLAREGQIVSSGTSSTSNGTDLLDLTDISRIFAEVNVDESDIAEIREGLPALIHTESATDKVYEGKVVYITPKGVRSRAVVNFAVRVEILEKENPALRPEMSTNVDIILDQRKNALTLPRPAIIANGDKQYVLVLKEPTSPATADTTKANKEERTEKREVTTGLADGESIEILSGLNEGETVIMGLSADETRWINSALDKGNMTKQNGKRVQRR